MTGFELRIWRRGQHWTQDQAAEALGVSLRTYKTYEACSPPKICVLATQALENKGDIMKLSYESMTQITEEYIQECIERVNQRETNDPEMEMTQARAALELWHRLTISSGKVEEYVDSDHGRMILMVARTDTSW
ncbi:helix-turn-helix transcriptional regulator [Serratia marcescens]|uniref:helix-turn-helix transcriptional regulator n=1 Tax=Serratia marcescens TaxID=615 RepID=UPI0032049C18